MRIFGTSDHHFWHRKIIEYGERPFQDLEDMHSVLTDRWNQVVGEEDLVIHAGDFALGRREKIKEVFEKLRGRKVLVAGNHDRHSANQFKMTIGFVDVHQMILMTVFGKRILFRHEPFLEKPEHVDLVFHGHVHQTSTGLPWNVNLSVEANDYRPVELLPRILELCPDADREMCQPVFTAMDGEFLNKKFVG